MVLINYRSEAVWLKIIHERPVNLFKLLTRFCKLKFISAFQMLINNKLPYVFFELVRLIGVCKIA